MPTPAAMVLDVEELRNLTMDDRRLMSEILDALLEDASRHAGLLETALAERDGARSTRIARAAARACANVGANAAAEAFRDIERHAARRDFHLLAVLLAGVRAEIDRLRAEAARI